MRGVRRRSVRLARGRAAQARASRGESPHASTPDHASVPGTPEGSRRWGRQGRDGAVLLRRLENGLESGPLVIGRTEVGERPHFLLRQLLDRRSQVRNLTQHLAHVEPTPPETLIKAYELAKEAGLRYVYVGNIQIDETESTFCPKCGRKVIDRGAFFTVSSMKVKGGKCGYCNAKIDGVFGESKKGKKKI